jgi:hypothetical protein
MAEIDEREEALKRIRAKREAYRQLFGEPGKPSAAAAIVLADLETFCTSRKESLHLDLQGRVDPYATIYRDGKKAVMIRIRETLEWSEDDYGSGSPDGA